MLRHSALRNIRFLYLLKTPAHRQLHRPFQESIRNLSSAAKGIGTTERGSVPKQKTWKRPRPTKDLFESMEMIVKTMKEQNVPSLKSAFLFWVSKAAREQVARRKLPETLPLEHARRILDFVKTNDKVFKHIVKDDHGSIHAGWTRLIHLYLRALQGTRASMREKGRTDQDSALELQLRGLMGASDIEKMLDTENMVHDMESSRAILNLWSKRCRFLAGHPDVSTLTPRDIAQALGGATTTRECVDAIRNFIQRIEGGKGQFEPDVTIYSYHLGALAISKLPGAVDEALDVMQDLEQHNPSVLNEAKSLHNSILLAFANAIENSEGTELVEKAERWWDSLHKDDHAITKDPIAYSIWMKLRSSIGQTIETEQVLDLMLSVGVPPSVIHYNIALNAWANAAGRTPQALERAEALLKKMTQSDFDIRPDHISYTAVLKACLNNPGTDSSERANAILDLMEEDASIKLDTTVYREFQKGLLSRLQRASAKQEKRALAIEVQKVFYRMRNLARIEDLNACLFAWSLSYADDAFQRMQKIYDEICGTDPPELSPDGHTFRTLMMGLANQNPTEKSIENGRRLMDRMKLLRIPLHVGVINQYVRLLARGGESLLPAVDFVLSMEEEYESGESKMAPQENTYRYILEEYWKRPGQVLEADRWFQHMKRLGETSRPQLAPSENSYSAMIRAWGDSKEPDALDRVEQLFSELKLIALPSSYTYAAYQLAWNESTHPDAAQRVEDIVRDMQQDYMQHGNPRSRPGATNFAISINAWAKRGAAERAEAILKRMEELFRITGDEHLKPTVDCYRSVTMAWAHSGQADGGSRAVQLLEKMTEEHNKNPDMPLPRRVCYHFAMVAIGRSKETDKAGRCWKLLQEMKENPHAEPIDATYSVILRSCTATGGSPEEKEEALEIVVNVMEEYFKSTLHLSEDVFDRFLAAVYRLHPANEERDELVERVFRDAPDNILRSKKIEAGMFKTASKEAAERILTRAVKGSVKYLFTEQQMLKDADEK